MASEGTYEYECMRAELLGVEKPDYEEFMKNKAERVAADQEALDAEAMREAHAQHEGLQHFGGKLDELNSILKSTQKKINNFAAPFSKFLKSKIGMSGDIGTSDESEKQIPDTTQPESNLGEYKEPTEEEVDIHYPPPPEQRKDPFDSKHIPVIDDLIEKCDRAQTSMEVQSKQMKKFLK